MDSDYNSNEWIDELRHALRNLYDPTRLQKNILIQTFHLKTPYELQKVLQNGIQKLKPSTDLSPESHAWRTYNLLSYRFIEQIGQKEVAATFAISIRHLRRLELNALHQLGLQLQQQFKIEPNQVSIPLNESENSMPSSSQELEWIRHTTQAEPVNLQDVMSSSLKYLVSIFKDNNIHVIFDFPENVPLISGQPTTLRQALMILLTQVSQIAVNSTVRIQIRPEGKKLFLAIHSEPSNTSIQNTQDWLADYQLAKQLLTLSGGLLELNQPDVGHPVFSARLTFSCIEDIPVLVIDDNADVLQLLERYLTNTRYTFIGTHLPEQALDIAVETKPRIIVLDVMLPAIDGWDLLGRLREHPQTQQIPIIICTILPHETLAKTLGAAGFIRKPVSRENFLNALNSLVNGTEIGYS